MNSFGWLILTFVCSGLFIEFWNMDSDGSVIGVLIGFILGVPLPLLLVYLRNRAIRNEERQSLEEKTRQENEKREAIQQSAKNGTWAFPAEKFYQQCTEQKVVNTSGEYGFKKRN